VLTKQSVKPNAFAGHLATPRYITYDDTYCYITNWGPGQDAGGGWYTYPNSYVLVADRWTRDAVKKIPCGSDAEGIISTGNKLYVATGEGVTVINKTFGTVVDTIVAPTFTGGAKHFVVDGYNQLWASYPGSGLLKINLQTDAAIEEITIPVDWQGQIAINAEAGKIYTYEAQYTSPKVSKIYELDIATKTQKEFATGIWFYSIGVSPATGNVYTAEVNNFSSNSELRVYNASGTLQDSQQTGVGTCDFKFFSIIGTK
jgi:hypothetical protein